MRVFACVAVVAFLTTGCSPVEDPFAGLGADASQVDVEEEEVCDYLPESVQSFPRAGWDVVLPQCLDDQLVQVPQFIGLDPVSGIDQAPKGLGVGTRSAGGGVFSEPTCHLAYRPVSQATFTRAPAFLSDVVTLHDDDGRYWVCDDWTLHSAFEFSGYAGVLVGVELSRTFGQSDDGTDGELALSTTDNGAWTVAMLPEEDTKLREGKWKRFSAFPNFKKPVGRWIIKPPRKGCMMVQILSYACSAAKGSGVDLTPQFSWPLPDAD